MNKDIKLKVGSRLIISPIKYFSLFLIIIITLMIMDLYHKNNLFKQCLSDGLKEYECHSYIYSGRTYR